jgi:hypothetical protein
MPPASGCSPTVASTEPILADSEAMIRSQANAVSSPPPTQMPCTTATIGIGSSSKARSISSIGQPKVAVPTSSRRLDPSRPGSHPPRSAAGRC